MKNSQEILLPLAGVVLLVIVMSQFLPSKKKEPYCGSCVGRK